MNGLSYMMRATGWGVIIATVAIHTSVAQQLSVDLEKISELRQGFDTDFDRAEQLYSELLHRYPQQEQVARINAAMAQFYYDTGNLFPVKSIECSKKALAYENLDPFLRFRSYLIWGDSLKVGFGASGDQLSKARSSRVIPYLTGLKEAYDIDVPNPIPALPEIALYSGQTDTEKYRAWKRRYDKHTEAWITAKFHEEVLFYRKHITKTIAHLYSRSPFVNEELRKLAQDMLPHEEAVSNLMSSVDAAEAERMKGATP